MPFSYPYPRPAVTCDTVVFTMRGDDLAVLLIQRGDEPFKGHWALPGGFVNENEALDRAAARELAEETGLTGARLEQIGAFGDPGRDPRGHTVTIAWATFLVAEAKVTPADDAALAEFVPLRTIVIEGAATRRRPIRLAFDHAKILAKAYRRLCRHLDDPVRDRSFDLFPSRFTIAELQHLYERILGKTAPLRAFKKQLLDRGLVIPATTKPTKKPAEQLYRWNRR
ncbi:MAG: NUDIX hydrolase [Labilithrix sp.]|nr:NUDIX hydrolase [Labilithrix sp.]MCW5811300.1 NUDIX hydrolase [Labilithrix sp.]